MIERPAPAAIVAWLLIFGAIFVWSAYEPKDRLTWWLEVAPALIALGLLTITFVKFPLTPLLYWLILIHCVILMVGAHYTYADVPLFNWLKGVFNGTRNNYDKVGHFVQGFVPAILAREILLRNNVLNRGGWLFFIVICICLAVSAFYEMNRDAAERSRGQRPPRPAGWLNWSGTRRPRHNPPGDRWRWRRPAGSP